MSDTTPARRRAADAHPKSMSELAEPPGHFETANRLGAPELRGFPKARPENLVVPISQSPWLPCARILRGSFQHRLTNVRWIVSGRRHVPRNDACSDRSILD
jgi:hypothetical protein